MRLPTPLTIDGYELAADRHYDRSTHMWVDAGAPEAVRCGFDPLGSETSGDLVAISFAPVGTRLARGEAFGSLEAAKFVGPLTAPVSGKIKLHNEAVVANPGLVNRQPLAHWFVELEADRLDSELPLLLCNPDQVRAWFASEITRFRQQGMLAE